MNKYTDDERVAALARLAANDGNVSRTGKELHIPRATLISWRDVIIPHLGDNLPTVIDTLGTFDTHLVSLADRVRREIEYLGFGNLSDVVQWDHDGHLTLTDSDTLTPAQAAIISEIKVKRTRNVTGRGDDAETWVVEDITIRTRDKLAALRVLAGIEGLLVDRRELSGPNGGPMEIDIRAIMALADRLEALLDGG